MLVWCSLAAASASRRKRSHRLGGQAQAAAEDLQGHPAVERDLPGLVDDAHAAAAQLADDLEVAQALRQGIQFVHGRAVSKIRRPPKNSYLTLPLLQDHVKAGPGASILIPDLHFARGLVVETSHALVFAQIDGQNGVGGRGVRDRVHGASSLWGCWGLLPW